MRAAVAGGEPAVVGAGVRGVTPLIGSCGKQTRVLIHIRRTNTT